MSIHERDEVRLARFDEQSYKSNRRGSPSFSPEAIRVRSAIDSVLLTELSGTAEAQPPAEPCNIRRDSCLPRWAGRRCGLCQCKWRSKQQGAAGEQAHPAQAAVPRHWVLQGASVEQSDCFGAAGSIRSKASRMRSIEAICVSSQNRVRALAKPPFSVSLLTGTPPPQIEKYGQVARQVSTPSAMSRAMRLHGRARIFSRIKKPWCSPDAVLVP